MASDDFTLDRQALKTYFKCSDRECNIVTLIINIIMCIAV